VKRCALCSLIAAPTLFPSSRVSARSETRISSVSEDVPRECNYSGHVSIGLDWVYDMESLLALVRQMAQTYPDAAYDREIQLAKPEQLPQLTEGLLRRGYAKLDVRNILGLNWVRVAQQVWK
jgi:membrane dipeptidase